MANAKTSWGLQVEGSRGWMPRRAVWSSWAEMAVEVRREFGAKRVRVRALAGDEVETVFEGLGADVPESKPPVVKGGGK